jgi:hypothetical protein
MKRAVLVLFVITAISSILYARQNNKGLRRGEPVHQGYLKAGDYLEYDKDSQSIYAMGLMDGMFASPMFGAPAGNKSLQEIETCTTGMPSTQVAAIIEKYVKNNPEKWNWPLNGAAYNAMLDGCRNR